MMKFTIAVGLLLCVGPLCSGDQLFCVDSYNFHRLEKIKGASEWKVAELPDGSRFFSETSAFIWNPDFDDIGVHELSFECVYNGSRKTTNLTVRVKALEKALFVLAHEDDELCIVGKIKQLVDAGNHVSLLWTRFSDKIRRDEAAKAMGMVGVRRENMHFWNYGSLSDPTALRVYIDRFADLISKSGFDQVYVLAYEGGHIEHDLTHIATVAACRECAFEGQIYEFGLYHLENLTPQPFSLLPAPSPTIQMHLSKSDVGFIENVADVYISQKQVTLGFELLMSANKKAHPCYRPLPNWDYMRPPAKGPLWYEVNLKHPASFGKHLLPALNANIKANPAFQNRNIPYAQDESDSRIGDLTLPDKKGDGVANVRFPYSVYAYSGLLLLFMLVGILPFRIWQKCMKAG